MGGVEGGRRNEVRRGDKRGGSEKMRIQRRQTEKISTYTWRVNWEGQWEELRENHETTEEALSRKRGYIT